MKHLLSTLAICLLAITTQAQNTTFQATGSGEAFYDASMGIEVDKTDFRYSFNAGIDMRTEINYFQLGASFDLPIYEGSFIGVGASSMFGGEVNIRPDYLLYAQAGYRFGAIDIMNGIGYFKDTFYWRPLSIRFILPDSN